MRERAFSRMQMIYRFTPFDLMCFQLATSKYFRAPPHEVAKWPYITFIRAWGMLQLYNEEERRAYAKVGSA